MVVLVLGLHQALAYLLHVAKAALFQFPLLAQVGQLLAKLGHLVLHLGPTLLGVLFGFVGKLAIVESGGALRLQFGQNITAPLRHWEHDTFRAKLSFPPDDEWLIRFILADGRPAQMEVKRIFWHEPMPVFRRTEADRHAK